MDQNLDESLIMAKLRRPLQPFTTTKIEQDKRIDPNVFSLDDSIQPSTSHSPQVEEPNNQPEQSQEENLYDKIQEHLVDSFVLCRSRFSGTPEENVEDFIRDISVFKEYAKISDLNAFNSLSVLLDKGASVWWYLTKSSCHSLDCAKKALRQAFGKPKTLSDIYRKLFVSKQHEDENTFTFIITIRTLFEQLPEESSMPLRNELDIVYSLLSDKIACLISRKSFQSFNELLEIVRDIENTLYLKQKSTVPFDAIKQEPLGQSEEMQECYDVLNNAMNTETFKYYNLDTFNEDSSKPEIQCLWQIYEGQTCGLKFAEKSHLVSHLENTHKSVAKICFWKRCPYFGIPFQGKKSTRKYDKHFWIHTGYKPIQCPFDKCGLKFKDKAASKVHKKCHEVMKTIKCTHNSCKRVFSNHYDLHTHLNWHKNVLKKKASFTCPKSGCEKAFKMPVTLRAHTRIHHNEIEGPKIENIDVSDENRTSFIPLEPPRKKSKLSIKIPSDFLEKAALQSATESLAKQPSEKA